VLSAKLDALPPAYTPIGDPKWEWPSLFADHLMRARYSIHQLNEVMTEFQRGGADGLNIVVPYLQSEHDLYRSYRPGLFVDRAAPGTHDKSTRGGWLNRWLQTAPPSADPMRAVAFGPSMPDALVGSAPALSISDLDRFNVTSTDPGRNDAVIDALGDIYGQPPGPDRFDEQLASSDTSLVSAIRSVTPGSLPAPSQTYPSGDFGQSMRQLAQLIRSDLFSIEVAEVDIANFDTHAQQPGRHKALVQEFSDGIAAFVRDLGPTRMQDVIMVGRIDRPKTDLSPLFTSA